MSKEFVPLAERIVDAILEASPTRAGYAGDHRFDDRLPDFSPDGVYAQTAMLRDAGQALAEVDTGELDAEGQVDHAVLMALAERMLFELTEVRGHEWDPLAHNPGPLLHGMIARPYAPVDERLVSLAGRLRVVPDALAVARTVLRDCPRIHLETAIGQFAGTAAMVRNEVPALVAEVPTLAGMVQPAVDAAVRALDEFGDWLRGRLAPALDGGRDPRLGRRLWEARLWHTLDTEMSAAEVLARAEATVERVGEELRAAAAELMSAPARDKRHLTDPAQVPARDKRRLTDPAQVPARDDTVRRALDQLGAEHPDNSSIVDLAKLALTEATAFVGEHDLVSLVDDVCEIQEMPEFSRGIAVAYCDPPGPLEIRSVPTFYCIAPTPADWSAERDESFYREYNNHMVRNLTVHEAMPGHFLQLAHSRRYRGDTRVRAIGHSGSFVEGWAVHAEEVMADHGFGGLPVRLQQLKMQLRMSLNTILDQLVHCAELPEADAMALMTERGFQEYGEAAGKWRRALLTSTQLSTYFVGYQEVSAVARARPAGVPVGRWHDQMLAHGSPAPRHLAALMLDQRGVDEPAG